MEISVKQDDVTAVHQILVDNEIKFFGRMSSGIDKLYKFELYVNYTQAVIIERLLKQARIKIY